MALRRRSAGRPGARAQHRSGRFARRGPRRPAPRSGFDPAAGGARGITRVLPRRRAREFARIPSPARRSCGVCPRHSEAANRAAHGGLSAGQRRDKPRCAYGGARAGTTRRADHLLPLGAARRRHGAHRCAVRGACRARARAGAAGGPEPERCGSERIRARRAPAARAFRHRHHHRVRRRRGRRVFGARRRGCAGAASGDRHDAARRLAGEPTRAWPRRSRHARRAARARRAHPRRRHRLQGCPAERRRARLHRLRQPARAGPHRFGG